MKKSTKRSSISYISKFTRYTTDLEKFKNDLDFNNNHGLCGSINLGNTCFMNSSIACLSNCSELTEYFLRQKYINDINEDNRDGAEGALAEEWYNLLGNYWLTKHTVGNPKNIKIIVGSKNRKFSGYNQQDSNEFMTVFLEILGEDLNRAKKKVYRELKEQQKEESDLEAAFRFWRLHVERNDSIITDLFHGLLKSTITCPNCGFKNITYDPFNTLTLTIPSENKIYQLQEKRKKIVNYRLKKEKKEKKEKVFVDIYYVFPFSLIQTKRFHIEVYKSMSLIDIMKEIQKRSDKRISLNLKYISVSNKECEKFLEPKKDISNANFIFSYEKEDRGMSQYHIPLYIRDKNKMSAYPRILFLNKNSSYNEFKKKIYILIRKYLNHPLYDPQKKEDFLEDKELNNYILGNSNKLDKVSNLLEKEFNLLQKNYANLKEYKKKPPYKVVIKFNINEIKKYTKIYDVNENNLQFLSQLGITSENSYVDNLLNYIKDESPKKYLFVELNNDSSFVKKGINFDTCIVENCPPIKEEENKNYEEEMEIEDDEADNQYSNSGNITLDHCLQYFTEEESLEKGNEWHCNKCKRRVMASKQIELFYLPRIMCICLTRFLKKGRFYDYTKNNSLVEFPLDNLNMERYLCGPDKFHSKYDLFAVSQHFGGMGGGHYTAVCKNIDGFWYEYDDRSLTRISPRNVCSSAAYVLFYRRQTW